VPTVRRFEDLTAFREAAEPFLMRDEARHNLQLGICSRLESDLHAFGDEAPYLSVAVDGEDVVAVAIRTPPFNVLLSRMDPPCAAAFAEDARGRFASLPGVNGEPAASAAFAEVWSERSGQTVTTGMRTRIHRLTSPPAVPAAHGRYRDATAEDRGRLVEWFEAFGEEAHPGARHTDASDLVDLRLSGADGGVALWEDEEPVSLSAHGGATPNGIRIGPVYTPPDLRGRGYAGACVATQSGRLLAAGHRFCFLFTDLANPVANRLYGRLGYEAVCDLEETLFEPAAG
jgi:predicted GNAT family acetyltransferase